nr:MAG TPA: hypothetical protein [Caudoviricetes sp.]
MQKGKITILPAESIYSSSVENMLTDLLLYNGGTR